MYFVAYKYICMYKITCICFAFIVVETHKLRRQPLLNGRIQVWQCVACSRVCVCVLYIYICVRWGDVCLSIAGWNRHLWWGGCVVAYEPHRRARVTSSHHMHWPIHNIVSSGRSSQQPTPSINLNMEVGGHGRQFISIPFSMKMINKIN